MTRLLSLVFATLCLFGTSKAAAPRPNIIFILCDDLGPGDLGILWQNARSTNQKFPTPHLDQFAHEGMILSRHYCPAPVCAPSRASLYLGRHQGHANVRNNSFDKELDNNHTLGSVMKQAGYATSLIGKWGLQGGSGFPGHPQNRGFDYFFGYLAHLDAHYHYPNEGGKPFYDGYTNIQANLQKCYSTDLITARTKKWIIDHQGSNPNQPFFTVVTYSAPHAGLRVPTNSHLTSTSNYPSGGGLTGGVQWIGTPGNMINTAAGTYDTGIHPDYTTATNDTGSAWPDNAKRHATMVRRIDDGVQDIIQTLKDLNLDENTLIVFTSDNGAHNEGGADNVGAYNPTYFDSFGPYDGIKRDLWEGGVRMPTLVRWPSGITSPDTASAHPSQFHDWMATFCDLAGVPSPALSDGISLAPTLTGSGSQKNGVVYCEYSVGGSTPNYAEFESFKRGKSRNQMQFIHIGDYKGVRYNIGSHSDDFLIYDVVNDSKETTDLNGQSGVPSQQDFKNAVLRVRRAGSGYGRPYDSAQIPPLTPSPVTNGLVYRSYEESYPWVPQFETNSASNSGDTLTLDLTKRTRDDDIGIEFTGYLDVPSSGTYKFYLNTDGKAIVRLHDALLIDADFNYSSGSEVNSGNIPLQAGKHPISIRYIHSDTTSHSLNLLWEGPSISKQAIPASQYYRDGNPAPSPPEANDDLNVAIPTNTSILIDVLNNDQDLDGLPQALSIQSITQPSHGTAVIESSQIRYTPSTDYAGSDSFTYTITDGESTDSATVTLSIQDNHAPVATADFLLLRSNTSKSIDVLANDNDSDGPNPIALESVGTPLHGSATISNGVILYTPSNNYTGSDEFTYQVSDGAKSSTGQVRVQISAVPDFLWVPMNEGEGNSISDVSGYLLSNTASGSWTPGKYDFSLNFNGDAEQVEITSQTYQPPLGKSERTVTAWLKPNSNQPEIATWLSYGPNNSGERFSARTELKNGDIVLRLEIQNDYRIGSTKLDDGQWHHVAMVVEDLDSNGSIKLTEVKFYVDGVLDSISEDGGGTPDLNTGSSTTMMIAGSPHSDKYNYAGGIDDVRIYPTALNASQINELAGRTPGTDAWHFQHTGNASPTQADWQMDEDNDGLSRYLELALGGRVDLPDYHLLPQLIPLDTSSAEIIFNMNLNVLGEINYQIEHSNNLQPDSWNNLEGILDIETHPQIPGMSLGKMRITLDSGSPTLHFYRLNIGNQ
ncbi:Arylsulfatase A [Rubritalea squalenifaciens DSM 18772]|uniref:Arylsulfatase A n=1 Tax=Rubritalea squalenifaciens DSM 18772 TaxID=1123071 RepID=A0A1M6R8P3_9BACT|nr:sulfatase-like hydrolase/transferase [Rubritalea squalenifaciens]SHK28796.1 Arylsulfatase A [Rubritalea squalenifaciens DSM 18772]